MYLKKLLFLYSLTFLVFNAQAQKRDYTVSDAHAHNDYNHSIPFYTAYNAGFGSIEADVFPINGTLFVAHNKSDIQSIRTLKRLYIEPMVNELATDSTRKLKLLIDIKEDYKDALQLLIRELEPLEKYLYTTEHSSRPLMILISGNRPPPSEYKNYPGYLFFDDDLKSAHTPGEWKRVGLVSLRFKNYSSWNGETNLPEKDKKLLIRTIDQVHNAGKAIRFWDAPDNKTSWILQMKLGVDLIGTDKIQELADFLNAKKEIKKNVTYSKK